MRNIRQESHDFNKVLPKYSEFYVIYNLHFLSFYIWNMHHKTHFIQCILLVKIQSSEIWVKSLNAVPASLVSLLLCLHGCLLTRVGLCSATGFIIFVSLHLFSGARSGTVGWGTALQARRSRVQFLMVSLEFFIDRILPAALWPWGWLSL